MSKDKRQWRKTLVEDLQIKDSDRQSVRRIMSRLRSQPAPEHSSKNDTGAEITPVQAGTVAENEPVQKLHPSSEQWKGGYLKIPNEFLDRLMPRLSPSEAVVFLRLYRLSMGFNSISCTVGTATLAKTCNISENTCRTALRRLSDLKFIRQTAVLNSKDQKGTTYEICIGAIEKPVQNLHRSKNYTGPKSEPNTCHDDDHKKTDHHQSEVMRIYQSITDNTWKKSDIVAYNKIKNIPLEKIDLSIRLTSQRAPSHPNTLAYFLPEILGQSNHPPQSKKQRTEALKGIVEQVRARFVGGNRSYSDFVEAVKEESVRQGVQYDGGLLDEILDAK